MNLGEFAIFTGSFVILIFWLGQSLWIYLDARNRNERFALGWAILALFSVPVSLIVYLMVTRGREEKCKVCGTYLERGLTICTNCGKDVGKICTGCGNIMKESWNYCPKCKTKYRDN
ncbi:zinc ribbon domain-containing protein [Clostridium folliculivorans]|uniref:DZANK-type domain-containing protein n=1 Tax=Clostridium folliculivorans TaxID=2886038 RepID=A0A9W6DBG2_9CLOT|nr:zinc ribbon domain-containing protein [Clostridium folliculivorans]GKU26234.1 hypothetical protein CFOLD11_30610 [Clostridium folliculivorans]GKU31906.1 hypothetical protein CFB3_40140 [Clostridium folliculivorans]